MGEQLLKLLIVLQPGVEDRGDERRREPGAYSHPGLGSGVVVGFTVAAELVRGVAPNRRATLNIWALIAGRDIHVQGGTMGR